MRQVGNGSSRSDAKGNQESGSSKALTSIGQPIHYTTAGNANEEDDELQNIQIQHFLDTLAEVAIAITRRKDQLDR